MNCEELNLTLSCNEAKQLNPLVLAYIGDAAYEIFVRTYLLNKNINLNAHKLHVKGIKYVNAHAQSEYMKRLMDKISEEEIGIFKRGRNAKSPTVPKNANVTEYRMATGFETLLGYLHISGQKERLKEIFEFIIGEGEV
ncbi:ribonuclease-3 family protein [Clostridium collagenovorans DSM 3089]|uniref:Mini-ribonuclease 3 n=1 Tax=Clostridium collagenovorans DSM 3089 TaxID=1121306 RepID=A0A1M5YKW5_9CLOT|nr:ribonuclease III domain-containing protein [Clostridium collagenovorans]SHI12621.1 ribonuclease-3 family protein [Clostridium collagenovorans DSM 3089]